MEQPEIQAGNGSLSLASRVPEEELGADQSLITYKYSCQIAIPFESSKRGNSPAQVSSRFRLSPWLIIIFIKVDFPAPSLAEK